MTIKHSLLAATLALSGLAMAQDNYPSKAITLPCPTRLAAWWTPQPACSTSPWRA